MMENKTDATSTDGVEKIPALPEAPDVQPLPAEAFDEEEERNESPRGSTTKWVVIGALLVVFLGVAGFLGARLIRQQNGGQGGSGGPGQIMISSNGAGGRASSVRFDVTPAAEIPQEEPAVSGLFVRRDDRSIFLGTGNITMAVAVSDAGSPPDVQGSYDGPVVEVVVNHQTELYKDTTEMPEPDQAVDGVVVAQQTVETGSLEDLTENSMVTVWGEKQGDRTVARKLVYR